MVRHGADQASVTIETDDNLMPLIETVVENGTLQIRTTRRNIGIEPRRLNLEAPGR